MPAEFATGIATSVGICGFGAPGALRAALLGTVIGFCTPFAAEGVRRTCAHGDCPLGKAGSAPVPSISDTEWASDDDDELTLANASDRLRSRKWPVPDEMVIFGGNGQDGSFGVWVPRDGGARPIVVEIGEIFEDASLAVVGDDLESFVRAWGAYYLELIGASDEIKAEFPGFELPEELALTDDGTEDESFAILKWANPGLPDPRPDPYERGLTAAQVAEIARSPAS